MKKDEKKFMVFFVIVIGISLIHEFIKDVTAYGIFGGILGFVPTIITPIMAIGVYQLLKKNEKQVHVYSEEEKCIKAYHEAGHAVLATVLKSAHNIKKLSILPEDNNRAISSIVEIGELSPAITDSEAEEMLLITLGGRAAERIVVNNTFKTSEYDLQEANNLLTGIIRIIYGTDEIIEVREMLDKLEEKAVKILTENRMFLDRIAQELIEKGVVFGDDIEYIMVENILVKSEESNNMEEKM